MSIIKRLVRENLLMMENTITPPQIPNSMNFWHGGNLDNHITTKNGRYEYGAGLYLISHYETALKYAKGSRKLYLISVENGVDLADSTLSTEAINSFIKSYVIGSKRKLVSQRLERFIKDGTVKGYVFNNILINEKAIKPSNTETLRGFYVENGVDYEIVNNPFGWGEEMMVLYNMEKIVNTIKITSGDKLTTYDLR